MKKTIIKVAAFIGLSLSAKAQVTTTDNFQNEYQTFLENKKTQLLTADDDGVLVGGLPWKRLYGEKEYYLSPMTTNISEYNARIRQLDNVTTGIIKSKFHFINVEVSALSKSLLSNMNITIPDYIQDNVNVYLPQIDIDMLSQNNISFVLTNYGSQKFNGSQPQATQATIFSDGFETNLFPGSDYSVTNTGASCGWGPVNCTGFSHSGSWSIWCASTGTACNSVCSASYINNMSSYVTLNAKTITAYTNVVFTYWRWTCIHGGTADYLTRWSSYDGNSTWTLDGSVYGTDANDCGNWIQGTTSVPPSSPYYGVQWNWYSDGSFTDEGAWLDDLLLTGISVAGIQTHNQAVFNTYSYNNAIITNGTIPQGTQIRVYNALGQVVLTTALQNNIETTLPSGIYTVQVIDNTGSILEIKKCALISNN